MKTENIIDYNDTIIDAGSGSGFVLGIFGVSLNCFVIGLEFNFPVYMASCVYLNKVIEGLEKECCKTTLMVTPCHKDINDISNFGNAKVLYLNLIAQDKFLYGNIGKQFNLTPTLKYLISVVDRSKDIDPVRCGYHVKPAPIAKFKGEKLSGGEHVDIHIYERKEDGDLVIPKDDESFIGDLMKELQQDHCGKGRRKTTLAKQGKRFLQEFHDYTESQSPKRRRVPTRLLASNTKQLTESGDLSESSSFVSEASNYSDFQVRRFRRKRLV